MRAANVGVRENWDVGTLEVDGGSQLVIHVCNEYMAADIDGERVATYPDLIVTLAESDGMPTPAAHREPGERIVVLAVPARQDPARRGRPGGSGLPRSRAAARHRARRARRRVVTDAVVVGAAGITPADVVRVARELAQVELAPEAEATILARRAVVDRRVDGERLIYGLNTGLGHMRDHRVPLDVLQRYQRQMIEAHASGIGPPLDSDDVRAAMLARVSGAARGGAGLTLEAVQLLVAMLNAGVHPIVPRDGSVGAGDLMHMAAIAVVMIGRGEAEFTASCCPAAPRSRGRASTPIVAQPKEGLALVSSNGVAIGAGALVAEEAQRLARLADLACALSLEATRGNPGPFDEAAAAPRRSPARSRPRPRCARCSRAPTCTTRRPCSRCRIRSRSGSRRRSTAPTASRWPPRSTRWRSS